MAVDHPIRVVDVGKVTPTGPPGPAGPPGPPGVGVAGPPGAGVPPGGTIGQVVAKAGSSDYDTVWITPPAAGAGQVPTGRVIATTVPLTGGGDLSTDRTLAVSDFSSSTRGTVPASGGGSVNYLRADGTWASPPGASPGVPVARVIATTVPLTGGGDLTVDRTLSVSDFTGSIRGTVPASGGGTTNFLRADGTWVAPTNVRRPVVAQTGTTYAPVVADENTFITLSNAAAITVTLPQNSTQAFPIGAEVDFLWLGVGQVTFVAGTGATVNGTPGLKLRAQYSAATAKKIAANQWVVIGDLA